MVKRRSLSLKAARTLQIVTLAMLVTCVAQMVYWLWDEAQFTERTLQAQLEHLDEEVLGADALLARGASAEEVLALFPSLGITDGKAHVDREKVEVLVDGRRRRLIRYGSEGTFLVLVLVGGIAILSHTLRQPAELMRRQENFIAAVSHEFKTPLASIRLAAETIQLREVDRQGQQRISDRIVQDTTRLEAMVANILDAGRVSEGRLELHPESYELGYLIEPSVQKVACRAHLTGVEVEAELESELAVWCDRAAIVTVLDNLLGNALKSATAAGGGHVRVTGKKEGDQARIDVEDDGLGFEPDLAERLFEKFYRPGDELRRKSAGSGLGLYIVKTIVELSGGRVSATSEGEGRGAILSLWLPLASGGAA